MMIRRRRRLQLFHCYKWKCTETYELFCTKVKVTMMNFNIFSEIIYILNLVSFSFQIDIVTRWRFRRHTRRHFWRHEIKDFGINRNKPFNLVVKEDSVKFMTRKFVGSYLCVYVRTHCFWTPKLASPVPFWTLWFENIKLSASIAD